MIKKENCYKKSTNLKKKKSKNQKKIVKKFCFKIREKNVTNLKIMIKNLKKLFSKWIKKKIVTKNQEKFF